MNKKNSLTEDEFNKLIEKLSYRKEELEDRITINSVRASLRELGLSDVFHSTDIDEVRKQVNKEFKRRQFKSYWNFALLIIILTAPFATFGGYKLKEFMTVKYPKILGYYQNNISLPITILGNKTENSDSEIQNLQTLNDGNIPAPSLNTNNPSQRVTSLNQLVESQGLTFELKQCKVSVANPNSKTVVCVLSVTSNKANVQLYLYTYNRDYRKTRIIENGRENLANKIQLGVSYSNISEYNARVSNNLTKDIPINANLVFENVSLDTNKLDILEISFYLDSYYFDDDIKVEFRDIPLSES